MSTILRTIMIIGALYCICVVHPSTAQHSHATAPQADTVSCPEPEGNPGDYLYGHDCYHKIYELLNKGSKEYWDSCCKGKECRVTEEIQDAPPALKAKGIDYLVVVDGRLCPATAKHEVRMTPEQRRLAKQHPLYLSFLQHSHVCAAEPIRGTIMPRPKGTSPKYSPEAASNCPVIHCIVVPPRI